MKKPFPHGGGENNIPEDAWGTDELPGRWSSCKALEKKHYILRIVLSERPRANGERGINIL